MFLLASMNYIFFTVRIISVEGGEGGVGRGYIDLQLFGKYHFAAVRGQQLVQKFASGFFAPTRNFCNV
jgi:hypothetical protein